MAEFTDAELSQRKELSLDATYEIDAIVSILKREIPREIDLLPLQCLLQRLELLNYVCMSHLGGDDGRTTEAMRKAVHPYAQAPN